MPLIVRPYASEDALPTWEVFHAAVRRTAVRDYTEDAVRAWAPDVIDLDSWGRRRAAAHTSVACVDSRVIGFSDVTDDGLLDMLFVHPDHGGEGVARALVRQVLKEAADMGLRRVVTHASRTARPAFERFGFVVDRENSERQRDGHDLTNWDMHIDLPPRAAR